MLKKRFTNKLFAICFFLSHHNRTPRTVMLDFWKPFLLYILEGRSGVHGKTYEKHIGLWIRKRSQTIIIFLTSSIPHGYVNRFSLKHDIAGIIIEHCWYICNLNIKKNTFLILFQRIYGDTEFLEILVPMCVQCVCI